MNINKENHMDKMKGILLKILLAVGVVAGLFYIFLFLTR